MQLLKIEGYVISALRSLPSPSACTLMHTEWMRRSQPSLEADITWGLGHLLTWVNSLGHRRRGPQTVDFLCSRRRSSPALPLLLFPLFLLPSHRVTAFSSFLRKLWSEPTLGFMSELLRGGSRKILPPRDQSLLGLMSIDGVWGKPLTPTDSPLMAARKNPPEMEGD